MKISLLAILTGLVFFSSCKKEDTPVPSITLNAVNTTIVASNWRVTYYYDKTHDATASFSGYAFTFAASGAVTATKGSTTVNGSWTSGNDDSQVKFVLTFTSPADFAEISNDWHVIERTDTKIRLQDISGGGGGTEFLTFEKN
jgi:hypothetical protein